MKNLQLSLKTKWFEMTKSGIKTEDYREITPYWFARLVFNHKKVFEYCAGFHWNDGLQKQGVTIIATEKQSMFWFKQFSQNTMTLGYPKTGDTERTLKLKHKGIEIRTGNPDWGAEPNKLYFVIKHGLKL